MAEHATASAGTTSTVWSGTSSRRFHSIRRPLAEPGGSGKKDSRCDSSICIATGRCNTQARHASTTPRPTRTYVTRLDQVDGYLTGTGIAVLTCGRRAGDWTQQPDAWKTLGEMIARYEAEFSGRLLIGPDDVTRWSAEPPDGIGWGILGIEGFDALVRASDDLDRLPGLFRRGVRVFQLVETEASALGGAAVPRR